MDILAVVAQWGKLMTAEPESRHDFLKKDKPLLSNGQGISISFPFPEVFTMN